MSDRSYDVVLYGAQWLCRQTDVHYFANHFLTQCAGQ